MAKTSVKQKFHWLVKQRTCRVLTGVHKLKNPNYLFIDLRLTDKTLPGNL